MNAPAAIINGRWDLDVQFFSSTSRHTLFIEQDGNWLQGSHKGDFSTRELTGTIEGDQVKLRSVDHPVADNITFTFSGTLANDAISGQIHMGEYRTATFTAKRSKNKSPRKKITVPSGPPLAT